MESSIASNTLIKFEFSMLLMQPQSLTESCENEKSQSRSGIAPSVKKWGSGRDPRVHNMRFYAGIGPRPSLGPILTLLNCLVHHQ